MKRVTFIIIGVIVVILLLVIWVYMLFFGNGAGSERFADLQFGDTTDESFVPEQETPADEAPTLDVADQNPLRQLTTDPVAGFMELYDEALGLPEVRYMVAGIGHIFKIEFDTGEVVRISNTTIPNATKAEFTDSGAHVMVETGNGLNRELFIGSFSTTTSGLDVVRLSEQPTSFAGVGEQFMYSIATQNGLSAFSYDPLTRVSEPRFTIPFREATILWGEELTGPHYVYPKAASALEGYLYRVENGTLFREPVGGFGFSAIANNDATLFSSVSDGEYLTSIRNTVEGSTFRSPVKVLPEKCARGTFATEVFYCAEKIGGTTTGFPDRWYAGEVDGGDILWQVSPLQLSATYLINTETASGRTVDAINLAVGANDQNLYFNNRLDQTLWMLEMFDRSPLD